MTYEVIACEFLKKKKNIQELHKNHWETQESSESLEVIVLMILRNPIIFPFGKTTGIEHIAVLAESNDCDDCWSWILRTMRITLRIIRKSWELPWIIRIITIARITLNIMRIIQELRESIENFLRIIRLKKNVLAYKILSLFCQNVFFNLLISFAAWHWNWAKERGSPLDKIDANSRLLSPVGLGSCTGLFSQ